LKRREFLASGLLTAGTLASRCSLCMPMPSSDRQEVFVTVNRKQALLTIDPAFMGLGYEISSVAEAGLLSAADPLYTELVRSLGQHGVLRIGGNTADYARYSPSASAVANPYGTVVNDAALQALGSFLATTGWRLIWALNLGSGSENDAVAEAKAVLAVAGPRLLAFEIGNEPDLFSHEKHRPPNYGYNEWLAEYRRYKTALRAQIPSIPFAGPDVAGKTEWVTRFAEDEGQDIILLTHHYYREGQNPASTIEKLLGVDPKLQPQLATLSAASERCGKPYRICEVNSFSGGGRPGVSDTMGAALWVLDYMFTLAMNRCSGVNLETGLNQLGFVSSYSPIADDEQSHYRAAPEYYGMLAFSLTGRGQLLPVEIKPDLPFVRAYATQPDQQTLAVTLINKGAEAVVAKLDLGRAVQGTRATVVRLTASRIDASSGITLGGAEVSSAGTWRPVISERIKVLEGQLRVDLPAASATIAQVCCNTRLR
jgi:hypothetical protein